jgi:tRNA-dihydrouridine synthase
LQDVGIAALTIHGRTRKQLYKGPADWNLIGAVKNNPRIQIPIFGNGDVDSPEKALEMKNRYGVDGVMIGRASIGNPWIFREIKHFLATGQTLEPPGVDERTNACLIHLEKSMAWKSELTGIFEMRRHYANYFKGFDHFKEFRMKLVTSVSLAEIKATLEEVRQRYSPEGVAA